MPAHLRGGCGAVDAFVLRNVLLKIEWNEAVGCDSTIQEITTTGLYIPVALSSTSLKSAPNNSARVCMSFYVSKTHLRSID